MPFHLNILGGLELAHTDRPLRGAACQRKPLTLLALLARAGDRGLTREKLVALLSPESDEERGRGILKQLLYALRRDTGESSLVLGTTLLSINTALVTTDVVEFEQHLTAGRWEAAVVAYRGPFLDGVFLPGCVEFDSWADVERTRLAQQYRAALLALAQQTEGTTVRLKKGGRRAEGGASTRQGSETPEELRKENRCGAWLPSWARSRTLLTQRRKSLLHNVLFCHKSDDKISPVTRDRVRPCRGLEYCNVGKVPGSGEGPWASIMG